MSSRRSIIPPSASLSSFSTISEEDEYQPKQQEQSKQSIILQIANSTTFKRRLSRQSSLSWGYKPSKWIGASCFLFILPIPLLLRACCPLSACLLGLVTIFLTTFILESPYAYFTFFDDVANQMF